MVKVTVFGATGYAGIELVRWLLRHPEVELVGLGTQNYVNQPLDQVYPHLLGWGMGTCEEQDTAKLVSRADVIFTALPHGHAVPVAEETLARGKVLIDLGADLRFSRADIYNSWYHLEHPAPEILSKTVYGLPELHRQKIKLSRLVGNPGCYPTSAILALKPALSEGLVVPEGIIIDSKSGVTGAGRKADLAYNYCEINENISPYGVAGHRHTPEIEQELGILAGRELVLTFTPHLVPMNRGILSTVYARLADGVRVQDLRGAYEHHYEGENFVQLLPAGVWPHTKWVMGSNHCQIGLTVDLRTNRLVVASAIDNLVKGAAGQAVQNMNLVLGFDEKAGLEHPALYP